MPKDHKTGVWVSNLENCRRAPTWPHDQLAYMTSAPIDQGNALAVYATALQLQDEQRGPTHPAPHWILTPAQRTDALNKGAHHGSQQDFIEIITLWEEKRDSEA